MKKYIGIFTLAVWLSSVAGHYNSHQEIGVLPFDGEFEIIQVGGFSPGPDPMIAPAVEVAEFRSGGDPMTISPING